MKSLNNMLQLGKEQNYVLSADRSDFVGTVYISGEDRPALTSGKNNSEVTLLLCLMYGRRVGLTLV